MNEAQNNQTICWSTHWHTPRRFLPWPAGTPSHVVAAPCIPVENRGRISGQVSNLRSALLTEAHLLTLFPIKTSDNLPGTLYDELWHLGIYTPIKTVWPPLEWFVCINRGHPHQLLMHAQSFCSISLRNDRNHSVHKRALRVTRSRL